MPASKTLRKSSTRTSRSSRPPSSRGDAARPRERSRASAAPAVRVEGGVVAPPVVLRAAAASNGAAAHRGGAVEEQRGRRGKRRFTARGADKYELYQYSVQSPVEDAAFLRRVYRSHGGKKDALHLREDFCGTGLLTSHWIRRSARHTAEGFDIDPEPLGWGIANNFAPLGEAAARATLHAKDVREPSAKRPDLRAALNFSYFVFKERAALLDYFRRAHEDLAKGGVFVLDVYGGPEAMMVMQEVRKIDEGFTYVWDQLEYVPATGDYRTAIHFRFPDGTRMERAFRYTWRLWTLPEVLDVLRDAGFREVTQYWEGTAPDGVNGNGIFRRSAKGDNCDAWVTYIAAVK